jgi:FAD/FMN-containing dehydrogenase
MAFGNGGLVQYQCFVQKDSALETFNELLRKCQERGVVNYLSVLKRHKPDGFLISHGVDGYSLAMDFRVTPKRKQKIVALAQELNGIVLHGGGRFYFAKDSLLQPKNVEAYLGSDVMNRFLDLKAANDPESILQTNLWRRLFGSSPITDQN